MKFFDIVMVVKRFNVFNIYKSEFVVKLIKIGKFDILVFILKKVVNIFLKVLGVGLVILIVLDIRFIMFVEDYFKDYVKGRLCDEV